MATQYKLIGKGEAGKPYGHVPGHYFRDVLVYVSRRAVHDCDRWRVAVVEQWGSAQGYDEIHGSNRVLATAATSLPAAIRDVTAKARDAGINLSYLASAMSEAEVDAEDSVEREVAYA